MNYFFAIIFLTGISVAKFVQDCQDTSANDIEIYCKIKNIDFYQPNNLFICLKPKTLFSNLNVFDHDFSFDIPVGSLGLNVLQKNYWNKIHLEINTELVESNVFRRCRITVNGRPLFDLHFNFQKGEYANNEIALKALGTADIKLPMKIYESNTNCEHLNTSTNFTSLTDAASDNHLSRTSLILLITCVCLVIIALGLIIARFLQLRKANDRTVLRKSDVAYATLDLGNFKSDNTGLPANRAPVEYSNIIPMD